MKQRSFEVYPAFERALTCIGSVESRTCSSGNPAILPKVFCMTSGPWRLDPPMPSSNAWEKPSLFAASAIVLSRSICAIWPLVMPSHPSHCPSSAPVQSDASRAQSLRTLPFVRQSPMASSVCQCERLGQSRGLLIDLGGAGFPGALSDGAEQLVEGIAEELNALGEQLVGDLLQRNAGALPTRRERVERFFQGPRRGWRGAARDRGTRRAWPGASCSRCRGR